MKKRGFTLVELSVTMAIVVIFGLMVATFLTLVVVPILYVSIEESKDNLAAFRRRVKSFIPGSSVTDK